MRSTSIGFTAPTTRFPGAIISIHCTRYVDSSSTVETAWAINVLAEQGGWVDAPGADVVEDDLESFVSRLSVFYDGTALWTLDETEERFTFWEMIVRTLPENML